MSNAHNAQYYAEYIGTHMSTVTIFGKNHTRPMYTCAGTVCLYTHKHSHSIYTHMKTAHYISRVTHVQCTHVLAGRVCKVTLYIHEHTCQRYQFTSIKNHSDYYSRCIRRTLSRSVKVRVHFNACRSPALDCVGNPKKRLHMRYMLNLHRIFLYRNHIVVT